MEKTGGPLRVLFNLDLLLAGLALAALVAITVSGVVMRYAVNRPITWLEEVQLACFVWLVFSGAVAVTRKSGHIAIDAFVGLFPRGLRKGARFITQLMMIAVLSCLCYFSFRYVQQMYGGGRATNILHIPYFVIYGIVPAACAVMAIISVYLLLGGTTELEAAKEAGNV